MLLEAEGKLHRTLPMSLDTIVDLRDLSGFEYVLLVTATIKHDST